MKSALIIFLKYPQQGKVKTRLAEDTSNNFAAKFYRHCSESVLNEIKPLKSKEIEPILFIENEKYYDRIFDWTEGIYKIYSQEGEDLGERMFHAFHHVFTTGFENAVIIGTDIPDLSALDLHYAFDQLSLVDIVIGPSNDGGYYLLGMNNIYSKIFQNIEWSTNTVFSSTLNIIGQNHFSYLLMQMQRDIDYKTDLDLWLKSSGGNTTLKSKIKKLIDDGRI